MKKLLLSLIALSLLGMMSCNTAQKVEEEIQEINAPGTTGMFIHITKGVDHPHEVLMALRMAEMVGADKDVLVYFDIHGIEVLLKDAPDITYAQFPSSHKQLQKLMEMGIPVMACPGCLEAAGKSPEDLMEGIQVANKETFFNFTEGSILTLDY